eukprot:364676-Chlamydomonas_euryale.AAC.4
MGGLGTVHNGMSSATAPSPLLDALCLARFNTGIPFVGPLLVTLDSDSDISHCWPLLLQNATPRHAASPPPLPPSPPRQGPGKILWQGRAKREYLKAPGQNGRTTMDCKIPMHSRGSVSRHIELEADATPWRHARIKGSAKRLNDRASMSCKLQRALEAPSPHAGLPQGAATVALKAQAQMLNVAVEHIHVQIAGRPSRAQQRVARVVARHRVGAARRVAQLLLHVLSQLNVRPEKEWGSTHKRDAGKALVSAADPRHAPGSAHTPAL